jgi:hypothetical protein
MSQVLLDCPLLERRRIVRLATLDFIIMVHLLVIPALLGLFQMEQRVGSLLVRELDL